jgi:hypothetical protein
MSASDSAPTGPPAPTLILSQALFSREDGETRAGPAQLSIGRHEAGLWRPYRLQDPDSNVFHGSVLDGEGLLTLGGDRALLRRWTRDQGRWQGRFHRLRDIARGDVDHDGTDEFIIASHDQGVVAVLEPAEPGGSARVIELDPVPDTFVHEVEVGDLDGDGAWNSSPRPRPATSWAVPRAAPW